jgi:hypothetical protein
MRLNNVGREKLNFIHLQHRKFRVEHILTSIDDIVVTRIETNSNNNQVSDGVHVRD